MSCVNFTTPLRYGGYCCPYQLRRPHSFHLHPASSHHAEPQALFSFSNLVHSCRRLPWSNENPQSTSLKYSPTQQPSKILLKVRASPNTSYATALTPLGILHTIFFHRYFPSTRPSTTEILDLTLPVINDVELETLIDSRVTTLIQQLSSTNTHNGGIRGQIAVQFFEKRRRKSGLWFGGLGGKGEEEICWEIWSVEVTLATPRTEQGESQSLGRGLKLEARCANGS
jgi:hypothetical protein